MRELLFIFGVELVVIAFLLFQRHRKKPTTTQVLPDTEVKSIQKAVKLIEVQRRRLGFKLVK